MSRRRQSFQLHLSPESKDGIVSILFFVVAILLALSIVGSAGAGGAFIDHGLALLFGWMRVVLPISAMVVGYSIARGEFPHSSIRARFGSVILFVSLFPALEALSFEGQRRGGSIGSALWLLLSHGMGSLGAGVIVGVLIFLGLLLCTDRTWLLAQWCGRLLSWSLQSMRSGLGGWKSPTASARVLGSPDVVAGDAHPVIDRSGFLQRALKSSVARSPEVPVSIPSATTPTDTVKLSPKRKRSLEPCYSVDLLEVQSGGPSSGGDTERCMMIIERTFRNFGIEVEMGEWKVGPTVTQYTLKPSEGVKLSQITALHNDLALALAAHPIRIEAPIPGKSLVGIEVPNQRIAIVSLKSILDSDEYRKKSAATESPLLFALGQDVAGTPWIGDLTRMPHLLIAGATGSGKSIMLNTIIMSLLYHNRPEDLKLILIDPKRVELPVYNGIPHLVIPAITDVRKTINALRWLIGEMDRRFTELQRTGHRDIGSYNQSEELSMPYMVVIVDELADLMATSANEVEGAIIRLAQMSRAVGIHLILATQRPSVDVITGLIKANITARIAFSVASSIDSRTILDQPGADKLLGRGDMLFLTAELSKPKRIQGAYVTDREIKRVTDYVRSNGTPMYDESIVERPASAVGGSGEESPDDDPLLEEAKSEIMRAGKGSATLLQRRLKVGYSRAARLLDLLEERGVIGPADGAKPREVLIKDMPDDTLPVAEEEISTEEEYGDKDLPTGRQG